MATPAGGPARPLGAPPCRLDPDRWMVPGSTPDRIRKAVADCRRCPARTDCLRIPKPIRPHGTVLGGMIVTVREGNFTYPEEYLKKQFRDDRPAKPEKAELYGVDLSGVTLDTEVIREIMRGAAPVPAALNRYTRQLAIAIGVMEMHLGDTEVAHLLPSRGGKPQPESVRRVRVRLGLPLRGHPHLTEQAQAA